MASNTNLTALFANATADREPFVLEILRRNCDAVAPELQKAYLDPIMMLVTACVIPVLAKLGEHALSLATGGVPKLLGAALRAVRTAARLAKPKAATESRSDEDCPDPRNEDDDSLAVRVQGDDKSSHARKQDSVIAREGPETELDNLERRPDQPGIMSDLHAANASSVGRAEDTAGALITKHSQVPTSCTELSDMRLVLSAQMECCMLRRLNT